MNRISGGKFTYHWHWTALGESRNLGAFALVMRTIWYEALPWAWGPKNPISR